jgi:hypothetical protein
MPLSNLNVSPNASRRILTDVTQRGEVCPHHLLITPPLDKLEFLFYTGCVTVMRSLYTTNTHGQPSPAGTWLFGRRAIHCLAARPQTPILYSEYCSGRGLRHRCKKTAPITAANTEGKISSGSPVRCCRQSTLYGSPSRPCGIVDQNDGAPHEGLRPRNPQRPH